jgi:FkbM family methyltransferase
MLIGLNHGGQTTQFAVALLKLVVPGIKFPLALRPDTSDVGTLVQTFLDRDYELSVASPPRLIIDAGANVGFVSALFANKFPEARIISIEPMQENYAVLCENAQPYANIQPLHAAVWSHSGTIDLVTHDENKNFLGHWGVQVRETANAPANAVRAVTISEVLASTGLPCIDILKIDIEGAEKEVFSADAGAWLAKTNMLIIELHDRFRAGCSEAVHNAVRQFGFMSFTRAENTFFVRTQPVASEAMSQAV